MVAVPGLGWWSSMPLAEPARPSPARPRGAGLWRVHQGRARRTHHDCRSPSRNRPRHLDRATAGRRRRAWRGMGHDRGRACAAHAAYGNPLAGHEGWFDGVGRLRVYSMSSDGRTRITAGATSIRAFAQPMREAAAVARSMLVGAAADRWGAAPSDCDAADGLVLNGGRTSLSANWRRKPPTGPRREIRRCARRRRPFDRPAASAARRSSKSEWQPSLRGGCQAAWNAVRIGPGRAAGREAHRLFERPDRPNARRAPRRGA